MSKPNLLYKAIKSTWMLDPMTAIAASKVFENMMGAARLKSEYPIIEYDEYEDELEPTNNYYNFRLTHNDFKAIPEGKQVNVVRLEGVMMRDEGWCQPGTRDLAEWLLQGDGDSRVIGNIIIIDSGGGAADSVRDLADAISACQNPVLAYCDGDMCSAAYYVGVYTKHIMAHDNRNRIGCIGTMVQLSGYPSGSKDEYGRVMLRIYADGSEDKNSDYEKALEGDFKLIKENMLNPLAADFCNDVKAQRPNSTDDQRRGRTFYAQDVVGTLIDSIGPFETAVDKVIELSNVTISTMKGHNNLQSLDSCHDLQMVDGYVSLNGEQLAEIDEAIGKAETEKALAETSLATVAEQLTTINELTQERDELKAKADQLEAKDAEIATLTQERDTLREESAQKDARIKELEEALGDDADAQEEAAKAAMHNGNPAKPEDEYKEATDEEAVEYCRKVLKGEF